MIETSGHLPECDEAWGWPDFMGGRGIDGSDCWMCGLLRRVRDDERQNMALQYLVTDREQQEQEELAHGVGYQQGYDAGVAAAREAVLAYADERLEMTRYPNKSEDITAALRVAARRIDGLQSATRTRTSPHDSSDTGTEVPYDGQWERDLYGGAP